MQTMYAVPEDRLGYASDVETSHGLISAKTRVRYSCGKNRDAAAASICDHEQRCTLERQANVPVRD